MQPFALALIFFVYGLSFFLMGVIVALERGRAEDIRLRHALRPLAGFGLLHGAHEWFEMFEVLQLLPRQDLEPLGWESLRLALLAFSFLPLSAFGASLLSPNERIRRLSLLVPLGLAAIWGFGLLVMQDDYTLERGLLSVADVWTRYVLAIPGALLACIGLIAQQRAFRRAGMARFGRDSLWAAVAFAWYGVIGQIFTKQSLLAPSTFINQELFLHIFGFPVQLLRASAAVVVAIFVTRFLRSFEVETQRRISDLQAARLKESQRREVLRGELLKRVVSAQEAERQRIARELHDETGQALTAIGLGLRGISKSLGQDMDGSLNNLKHLGGLVTHSLDELQRLIADLHPSHLDDLGLPAALRWYAGEIHNRTSLKVVVSVIGEPHDLTPAEKITLFRVAQEAITNVIKHADAQHVKIRLQFDEHAVKLDVEDDGCGFNYLGLSGLTQNAWGLLGMEERTSLLGGDFYLDSQPGFGTKIHLWMPYHMVMEDENDDKIIPG